MVISYSIRKKSVVKRFEKAMRIPPEIKDISHYRIRSINVTVGHNMPLEKSLHEYKNRFTIDVAFLKLWDNDEEWRGGAPFQYLCS